MKSRRIAVFRMSTDLLKEVMQMPKDARILRVSDANSWLRPDSFDVVVEHPDLPVVDEACEVPEVSPTITQERKFVLLKWARELTWHWGVG